MKTQRFEATLVQGRDVPDLEVPFDPAAVWSLPIQHLPGGRWGYQVQGTLDGLLFQGVIVPRSGRFFLLVDAELQRAAGLSLGDTAEVLLGPRSADSRSKPTPGARPKRRVTKRPSGAGG
jgi:hypothetical protein